MEQNEDRSLIALSSQMLRAVRVSTDVETRARMNALTQSAPGVRGQDLLSNRLKDHENDAERRTIARKR